MSPPNEGGPRPGAAQEAAAATPQARRHLIPTDRVPVQLALWDEPDYPADGMYPARSWAAAEWHLRLAVNRLACEREPRHWWAREAQRRRDGVA